MFYRLTPTLKHYLWGGDQLHDVFNKGDGDRTIAETWEVSCHPDGPSFLLNGQTLHSFFLKHPDMLGKKIPDVESFPFLVKLIDAKKALSIQVHPDDAYALKHEGEQGKSEMWYILAAEPDAYINLGFNRDLTIEEFQKRALDGTIEEVLNKVPVHKGEGYFIPAGTVHGIGAGVLLAEVQQSSNITYRVYDFKRRDEEGNLRPLHLDRAMEVTNFSKLVPESLVSEEDDGANTIKTIVGCPSFVVERICKPKQKKFPIEDESFQVLLILEDKLTIQIKDQEETLQAGEAVLIPAGNGSYFLHGEGKALRIYV